MSIIIVIETSKNHKSKAKTCDIGPIGTSAATWQNYWIDTKTQFGRCPQPPFPVK